MNKMEAARAARNAYQKAWRKKNPDKVKASNERYWIRVAEKQAAEAKSQGVQQDGGNEN